MRGYMKLVLDRAFAELWEPLTDHTDCPPNVFGEIYTGLRPHMQEPEREYIQDDDGTIREKSVRLDYLVELASSDPEFAEALLKDISGAAFESEARTLLAVRDTFAILVDIATDDLAQTYLELLKAFVNRYSLRYYVDDEARLWISFSGLATALFGQLRLAAESHPHLLQELNAFEHALAECLDEPVPTRIKTTIQKQVNVLEAFGSQHHLVSYNTLGRMFEEVQSWPHDSLIEAARQLYKFANDYPGIRHAGTYDSAILALDLRDLAGVTLSLVGLVAYLADGFELQMNRAVQGDLAPLGVQNGAGAPWLDVLADSTTTS